MWIDSNPNLTQVHVGGVQNVDVLQITNNPKLSASALANLQAFSCIMTGNADGNVTTDDDGAHSAAPGASDTTAAP